jgi:hypothetical protein
MLPTSGEGQPDGGEITCCIAEQVQAPPGGVTGEGVLQVGTPPGQDSVEV